MVYVPPAVSEVDGFHLSVVPVSANLAAPGRGDQLFEDWYITVKVTSDGTNPFCVTPRAWPVHIVRAKIPMRMDFAEFAEVVCQLQPGDDLSKICVIESKRGTLCGVWLYIIYEKDGVTEYRGLLLERFGLA